MVTRLNGMTTAEVAQRLGVTPSRVKQLRKAGRLVPKFQTTLGYLYLPSDVERYAESRTLDSTREINAEIAAIDDPHVQEGLAI